MAGEHTLEITDENFQAEVMDSEIPVLLDFWAEWCMPCKMLGPVIDELANDFVGKVKVGKVDTDNARETAMQFGISAIPTIFLLQDGVMVKKFVGLQQKTDLAEAIDEFLAGE